MDGDAWYDGRQQRMAWARGLYLVVGTRPLTSHAAAGVGITVKNSFLQNFEADRRWEVILPGRAAVLKLHGKAGSLDLFVVYFHTGVEVTRQEISDSGLDPDQGNFHPSQLRTALRNRLARKIRPQDKTLSFICGDFNFVMEPEDRRCLSTTAATGGKDAGEARHWNNVIGTHHSIHELFQPEFAYTSPNSRSRLD